MSEQENIKIAQSFFEAWNEGDLSKNEHWVADDFMGRAPGAPGPLNKEQSRKYNQGFLDAFPGSRFEVLRTIAQGDYVVTNWKATGTHTGPLLSPSGGTIPPTGKQATVFGSTTTEVKNGKAMRAWNYWDLASLLGQLGVLPPM